MAEKRKGLGRGLSALMADIDTAQPAAQAPAASATAPRDIAIELLYPNPDQPRRTFHEGDLDDLTASIKEKGVIQPLIVRPSSTTPDQFEIVAGERRWRAAQRAGVHTVPVAVRDFSDTEVLEVAIIENVQRADLSPLDEANAYNDLMSRFGHTQDQVAKALGKSRSHIANMLRLLKLPPSVHAHLISGALSAGHARALLTAEDPARAAQTVLDKGLSVRETEALMRKGAAPVPSRRKTLPEKDADTRALEADLSATLGLRVSIEHASGNDQGGVMTLRYRSLDQLDDLCRALGGH
ncbi:MAG: ParB/RepB/Spo0J family partition protein [Shimia sp.]